VRIALDTNRYVDFCRGEERAVEIIRSAERIHLPLFVIAELRAGFRAGSKGIENEKTLVRFLNSPRVEALSPDDQTTHHYAGLFVQLRKQGTPIPTNDLWIAALVVQHNLILFHRDNHFEHLPQIPSV
jgi:tRNA(fMet)-specific endonuclease VapC